MKIRWETRTQRTQNTDGHIDTNIEHKHTRDAFRFNFNDIGHYSGKQMKEKNGMKKANKSIHVVRMQTKYAQNSITYALLLSFPLLVSSLFNNCAWQNVFSGVICLFQTGAMNVFGLPLKM